MANKININELPYAALEINSKRIVININKLADDIGVVVGTYCWDTFGKRASISKTDRLFFEEHNKLPKGKIKCHHCNADKALEKQEQIIIEEQIGDVLWEIYWIPTSPDTYIHYGIDITKRK